MDCLGREQLSGQVVLGRLRVCVATLPSFAILELRVGWQQPLVVGGAAKGFFAAGLSVCQRTKCLVAEDGSSRTGSNVGLCAVVILKRWAAWASNTWCAGDG